MIKSGGVAGTADQVSVGRVRPFRDRRRAAGGKPPLYGSGFF
jgi:hypothetical protein